MANTFRITTTTLRYSDIVNKFTCADDVRLVKGHLIIDENACAYNLTLEAGTALTIDAGVTFSIWTLINHGATIIDNGTLSSRKPEAGSQRWVAQQNKYRSMRNMNNRISISNNGSLTMTYAVLVSNKINPGDPASGGTINASDWSYHRREALRWDSNQNAYRGDVATQVAANSTDMDRWKGPYRWTAVVGRTATGVPDTSTDLEFFEN